MKKYQTGGPMMMQTAAPSEKERILEGVVHRRNARVIHRVFPLIKFCEFFSCQYLERQKLILRFGLRGQQKQVKNLVMLIFSKMNISFPFFSSLLSVLLFQMVSFWFAFLKLNSRLGELPRACASVGNTKPFSVLLE